jgi:hypothetical protein
VGSGDVGGHGRFVTTGWFGRGSTNVKTEEYKERNERYLSRPARKQKEFIEANRSVLEGGNEFNIW